MDSAIAPDRHSASAERVDSSPVLVPQGLFYGRRRQQLYSARFIFVARESRLCQCGLLSVQSPGLDRRITL